MFARLSSTLSFTRINTIHQKRFRFKKKWFKPEKKKKSTERALEHFDQYYQPVYEANWPSIRCALLSLKKYCALINNFANAENIERDFFSLGAQNIFEYTNSFDYEKQTTLQNKLSESGTDPAAYQHQEAEENADLNDFVPVERIYSEKQQQQLEEIRQNMYEPVGITVSILPPTKFNLPFHLKPYMCQRGETLLFPHPKRDSSGKITYYLMDGACVLPVLALDMEPGCSVLDLCAAPGGKMLTMLQTMLPGKVVCMDHSYSRIQRLKHVIGTYLPRTYIDEKQVEIHHCDSTTAGFGDYRSMFDRVLVDVPCFTDRHVLHEEEHNIFRSANTANRLKLQEIQKKLLISGLLACRPGGSVVYSTCTLSPPQNDGVIQAALEFIWERTKIDYAVEDTTNYRVTFSKSFKFHEHCRYGQLVLPNVMANFGPLYFCKLKRLN